MKARVSAWILAAAAVAIGMSLGARYAVDRGMVASAREPLGAARELPEVAVAPELRPDARVGAVVQMTPYGYQPQTVQVRAGEAIAFRNAGIAAQRPVSDPHPAHDAEASLNAPGIVEPERTWFVIAPAPGTYAVHDEVYPNARATVQVR